MDVGNRETPFHLVLSSVEPAFSESTRESKPFRAVMSSEQAENLYSVNVKPRCERSKVLPFTSLKFDQYGSQEFKEK